LLLFAASCAAGADLNHRASDCKPAPRIMRCQLRRESHAHSAAFMSANSRKPVERHGPTRTQAQPTRSSLHQAADVARASRAARKGAFRATRSHVSGRRPGSDSLCEPTRRPSARSRYSCRSEEAIRIRAVTPWQEEVRIRRAANDIVTCQVLFCRIDITSLAATRRAACGTAHSSSRQSRRPSAVKTDERAGPLFAARGR
jgi:hypothetical protein